MTHKYFVMEGFKWMWWDQTRGYKNLHSALNKLREMMNWEGPRTFAVIKAETAEKARYALVVRKLVTKKATGRHIAKKLFKTVEIVIFMRKST